MPATRKTAAIVTALLGVVTAVVLFALVGKALTKPGTKSNLGRSVYDVGGSKVFSKRIADDGPILFQALVGNRDIYVQHLGDDPEKGWVAFDARAEGESRQCYVTWDKGQRVFHDPCSGRTYPADGAGLAQHPVTVSAKGRVSVDLRASSTP